MLQQIKDGLEIFLRYNVNAEVGVIDNRLGVRIDLDVSDNDNETLHRLGWAYDDFGSRWTFYTGMI